ncbi:hypothetical protein FRC00_009316 [Tulasnella sp. 408]|nr:hypothetical protein FRC00_009316 [Tulasnella sp. 408]
MAVQLVALPYVAWIIVAVLAGILSGDNVRRFPQYCASDDQVPSIISGIGAAFILIVAATLQIWTLLIVWARYRRTRKLGSREIGNIDVALFMRISMFSSLIVIALRDVLVCWHMAKRQQITSRSNPGTPGNTFASITAGQRSVPLGGIGSGHAYGTDGWDMERDIAHHQAVIRPTFTISSSNKHSAVDSDNEDIEMTDTKARQVAAPTAEEALRTVRVLSFDANAQPETRHSDSDVPPTPPPKSYQI